MAVDKLVDSTLLDADLTSVANAIRTKGGTSASLAFPADFVQAIEDIPSGGGGDSDSTIEEFIKKGAIGITSFSSDIAYGKQGYAQIVMRDNAFYNSGIETFSLPNMTYIPVQAFSNSSIKIANFPSVTEAGNNAFSFSHIEELYLKSYSTTVPQMCNQCGLLEIADLGNATGINANAFNANRKLSTVILRRTSGVCTLANVSGFAGTPIRGYNGLSGEIYVPNSLITAYQTATNWSTIYGEGHVTFKKIEGSVYE